MTEMDSVLGMAVAPWAFTLVAAVLGLVVGSFLNVVIHRLPRMMDGEERLIAREVLGQKPTREERSAARLTLSSPRSACPGCAKPLPWRDNVPVVSWLLLRGCCRRCGTGISARYPAIEALNAAFWALAAWSLGPGWPALCAFAFLSLLLALAAIDRETRLLPDELTQPLLWTGLLANAFGLFVPAEQAVLGAAAGYLGLWVPRLVLLTALRRETVAGGDLKLLAAIGAWLGWQAVAPVALIAAVAGLGAFAWRTLRPAEPAPARKKGSAPTAPTRHAMPFGPFLSAAAGLVLLAPWVVDDGINAWFRLAASVLADGG